MARPQNLVAAGLTFVVAGIHMWQAPLMAQQPRGPNLDEMFVAEDTDGFDPGLAIGTQFPSIRALYQGDEITSIDQFLGEAGAIFIANRSANW